MYSIHTDFGLVHERVKEKLVLWDDDGSDSHKGFKAEWAVHKDDKMWIGSHGRLETMPGAKSSRLRWIKVVDKNFKVKNHDWTSNYNKI